MLIMSLQDLLIAKMGVEILPQVTGGLSNDQGRMLGLNRNIGNRYKFEAGKARNDFKNYFNSTEEVPWQLKHVRSCG